MVETQRYYPAGTGFESQCEHVLCERCSRIYYRDMRKLTSKLKAIAELYPFQDPPEPEEELLINYIDLTKE